MKPAHVLLAFESVEPLPVGFGDVRQAIDELEGLGEPAGGLGEPAGGLGEPPGGLFLQVTVEGGEQFHRLGDRVDAVGEAFELLFYGHVAILSSGAASL